MDEPAAVEVEIPAPADDAPAPTLELARARRPGSARSRTIPTARRLSRGEKAQAGGYPEWGDEERPRTRGECGVARPCPYVSCSAHLYLDVDPETGALKLNFPNLEVWEMPWSCSLDEAAASQGDGLTLEQVAARMNLTRERIRQLEARVFTRADLLRVIVDE